MNRILDWQFQTDEHATNIVSELEWAGLPPEQGIVACLLAIEHLACESDNTLQALEEARDYLDSRV